MTTERKPNRLIQATSPYLLQHAYNPVDWYEWGTEALTRASIENKPILVSIGYSSCHWCHVMERESFEIQDIADIMNEHFVCIKVDREERPDIDQVYMEAVQALGGHGGWPLNVFLNPAQKPFYGGTYFPARNWASLLLQISKAFKEKRRDIDDSAEEVGKHLSITDLQRFSRDEDSNKFSLEYLDQMESILKSRFDNTWGGIEKAPKFVMPSIWLFLLRYYSITKSTEVLNRVTLTLKKMSDAGLYDQLGGGFSRYSVDAEWFAPHFEKMLYDNAQLLSLYSEAYTLTKEERFKQIVYQTVGWMEREMLHPQGGFYSALDADSENIEGKFYTWTWDEIHSVLTTDAERFCKAYSITKKGNWEHGRNILCRSTEKLPDLESERQRLFKFREDRIRPGLDDKILTGWNAMAIKGLMDAYHTFRETRFLELAEMAIQFIETHLSNGGRVYRAYKEKRSMTEGFLEDYAFLINAYLSIYEETWNEAYLEKARHWCDYTITNFFDPEESFFHFTGNQAERLIARKKEVFDNVIPASNSVMARNLFHLGTLLDKDDWKELAIGMVRRLTSVIHSEPGYMSHWGVLLSEITKGMAEVVVVGPTANEVHAELSKFHLPFALTMGTTNESELPLFERRKSEDGKTRIYVCFNKTCKLPVEEVEKAVEQITKR